MSQFDSPDPRAIQTKEAFQETFLEMLQAKSYQKISVTELAKHAGYARHTFYNHYDTLDDLLSAVIDSVLDSFFNEIQNMSAGQSYPGDEVRVRTIASFFHALKDNKRVVMLLNHLDMDAILVERLKVYFAELYHDTAVSNFSDTNLSLMHYMVSFSAYTFLGILKPWLADDMKHPPKVMAKLLVRLLGGPAQRRQVVEQFNHVIR